MQYQQQQNYQGNQYSGQKRQRGPNKPPNPNLVVGTPCPTQCGAVITLNTTKDGTKQYLKCPNQQCGEWGSPPQAQYQAPMIQNPPYPAQYTPQNPAPGVATFTPPTPPQHQVPQFQSQPQTTTPGATETLNVLSNRVNDLTDSFNNTLNILTNDLFRNSEGEEPGAIIQILDILKDLSSRLDQLQKDFGVSQESVKAHQSFLVAKKLPPSKNVPKTE